MQRCTAGSTHPQQLAGCHSSADWWGAELQEGSGWCVWLHNSKALINSKNIFLSCNILSILYDILWGGQMYFSFMEIMVFSFLMLQHFSLSPKVIISSPTKNYFSELFGNLNHCIFHTDTHTSIFRTYIFEENSHTKIAETFLEVSYVKF